MVKEIRKKEAFLYLNQADEFLASASQNLKENRLNAAGFSAIQSMINANDALTIYYLERRASKDHREAIKLHVDVVKIINDGSQRSRFKEAMDKRAYVGYLGTPISKKEAEKLRRFAKQFLIWVRKYVK
ncbi:MAG: HEPN domain-containing protein [Methanomassiliicoccales archaeon]|nr:MAG: HEPN domain-containing protein [Methanomassiliicoccales archaeon]